VDEIMKNTEWAYFAGLFDGEGSVTVSHFKRKTNSRSGKVGADVFNYSLRIANNDPAPLIELEKKFGGKVRLHSAKRESFVWIATSDDAVKFASGILPYCRIKGSQLEKFMVLMSLRNGNTKLTLVQKKTRMKLIAEIRDTPYRRQGLRLISG
jgi:hypothetical protein